MLSPASAVLGPVITAWGFSLGTSVSVTVTSSGALSTVPSLTTSWNTSTSSPGLGMAAGAVNSGMAAVASSSVTGSPLTWVQAKVIASPSGSELPEPLSVTTVPTVTVWSAPASAMGGRFALLHWSTSHQAPSAQLASSVQAVRQAPASHLKGAQSTVVGTRQAPVVVSLSQKAAATASVSETQAAGAHSVVSGSPTDLQTPSVGSQTFSEQVSVASWVQTMAAPTQTPAEQTSVSVQRSPSSQDCAAESATLAHPSTLPDDVSHTWQLLLGLTAPS